MNKFSSEMLNVYLSYSFVFSTPCLRDDDVESYRAPWVQGDEMNNALNQ